MTALILLACFYLLVLCIVASDLDWETRNIASSYLEREWSVEEANTEFGLEAPYSHKRLQEFFDSCARLAGERPSYQVPQPPDYLILVNAKIKSALYFGRFFVGVSLAVVLKWLQVYRKGELPALRAFLNENLFAEIKVADCFEFIGEGAPEDLLEAIQNILIRARLTLELDAEQQEWLERVFRTEFTEYRRFAAIAHDFVVPLSIRTESLLALKYYFDNHFHHTERDELVTKLISKSSLQEVVERGFLSMEWFNTKIVQLSAQVDGTDDLRTKMNITADTTSPEYQLRQHEWNIVLNDLNNVQLIRNTFESGSC